MSALFDIVSVSPDISWRGLLVLLMRFSIGVAAALLAVPAVVSCQEPPKRMTLLLMHPSGLRSTITRRIYDSQETASWEPRICML